MSSIKPLNKQYIFYKLNSCFLKTDWPSTSSGHCLIFGRHITAFPELVEGRKGRAMLLTQAVPKGSGVQKLYFFACEKAFFALRRKHRKIRLRLSQQYWEGTTDGKNNSKK
ncbi:Uncharacterized protein dnm_010230 [Desulfonema magnum]|uniref:Uncharacterized protein n=1 Tax=Desulfonema magnum TaxID=45655 RepID=A0A975GKU7_9BACT|nr:Uncharacterized protein dnm_010230 [Desulfonema magnum]